MAFRSLIVALIVFLGLAGCNKKPVAEDANLVDKSTPRTPSPQIKADLEGVNKNLEARQYDAAVGSLIGLNQMPKTDAEQRAYQKQLHDTTDALNQKAAQGDEKAAQSVRVLGRFITGR
jgi:hypothetical protein